jgi:hypothetical protein
MILRTVKVFGDGTRQEYTTNTSAQRGRYLMASNKAQDAARYTLRNVKNGYQYDTPRCNSYPHVGCITTVTLERGWA